VVTTTAPFAVVADPPEVRPGETATFRALVVDARRRTTGAQRAVFSTPELRALVVHFLKGPQ
jgi:hypothetical protein